MSWKDLFSAGASDYARYRPTYPPALFAWLANVAPGRTHAVDVGTGNGQAAVALAGHFQEVVGLDPSESQIARAEPRPNVDYRVARAEKTGLPAESADLVVAAQCFHWFDAPAFFAEMARVLRPRGILALVSYGLAEIDPAVDRVVLQLYHELDAFWEPERRLVEEGYRSVVAPFPELPAPPFDMQQEWTLAQLVGYLGTWSPLPRYRQERGHDPLEAVVPELQAARDTAATTNAAGAPQASTCHSGADITPSRTISTPATVSRPKHAASVISPVSAASRATRPRAPFMT